MSWLIWSYTVFLFFPDVITKASDHWDSSSRSSTSTHPKPKFEFPDLEPKQSDGRLIVDGKDMQEEVNNCKSQ